MEVIEKGGDGRRVRSMRRPMRRAYAGNYLDRGMAPPMPLPSNIEVARFLMESALADLGGVPLAESTPEGDERIARMMAAETVAALNRGGGKTSANWYTDAIHGALGVAALMYPELLSDAASVSMGRGYSCAADARCVFFAALAITSQNNTVTETVKYAVEQYDHFKEKGRFLPKVYGQKGGSVSGNLRRFNEMLDVFDGRVSQLREFLDTPFTMRELRDVAADHGIRLGGHELQDETVRGSMLFGPKIGNGFYQNLVGNHDVANVTFDLWWCRTWGRFTGTLIKGHVSTDIVDRLAKGLSEASSEEREAVARAGVDPDAAFRDMAPDELVENCRPLMPLWEGMRKRMISDGFDNADVSRMKADMAWPGAADAIMKGLARSVDQPERASDRKWMRSVVARALDLLSARGYRMSAADLQATLWYPERSLYAALSKRKADWANVSYDEALADVARKEGHHDDAVERARRDGAANRDGGRADLVEDGPGRSGDPGSPGCGLA